MNSDSKTNKGAEEPLLAKPVKSVTLQKGQESAHVNTSQTFKDLKPSEIIRNKSKYH